jgi:RNA polymerase sigma-70 factor (ECF subfamily)
MLEAFVIAHHARLTSLARLVCRDQGEASDAVQAAFEQAWRRRETLQDPASLRPWLDRIVVREAIRQGRARVSFLGKFGGSPREIVMDVADARSERDAAMLEVKIAYESLPANQRVAVALHLHLGYSVGETAQLMGAPVETVRSRLKVGRERLRLAMEDAS